MPEDAAFRERDDEILRDEECRRAPKGTEGTRPEGRRQKRKSQKRKSNDTGKLRVILPPLQSRSWLHNPLFIQDRCHLCV